MIEMEELKEVKNIIEQYREQCEKIARALGLEFLQLILKTN